jgi:hypothetical protein
VTVLVILVHPSIRTIWLTIAKDQKTQTLMMMTAWMMSTILLQESELELEAPDSMLDDIVPEVACGSKSLGPAPFYKVHDENDLTGKKKAIPVHYPTHYWFRGKQLSKLTAFKYAAMIQIIPQKQTLEEGDTDHC